MDLVNIRRVAWDSQQARPRSYTHVDDGLVEILTAKILERLR